MGHLHYGCLSKERKLRYYQMIERVCGGNEDTARKLWYVQEAKIAERRKRRQGPVAYTIAETFIQVLLGVYVEVGNDYDRAVNYWIGRRFSKLAHNHSWAVKEAERKAAGAAKEKAKVQSQTTTGDLARIIETTQAKYDAYKAEIEAMPEAKREALQPNLAAIKKAIDDARAALGTSAPAPTGPFPIAVRFKSFEEKEPNISQLDFSKPGGPVLRISAMGTQRAESFWRGALWGIWELNNKKTE